MRLYVQDRHTEEMAIFLRLADKRREHTHSPSGVKQYASRGSSSKFGQLMIELVGRSPTPGACLHRETSLPQVVLLCPVDAPPRCRAEMFEIPRGGDRG